METNTFSSLRRIRIGRANQPSEQPAELESFGAAEKYLASIAPTLLGARQNMLVEVEYLAGMKLRFIFACTSRGLDAKDRLLREAFAAALQYAMQNGTEQQRAAASEIIKRVRVPTADDIGA